MTKKIVALALALCLLLAALPALALPKWAGYGTPVTVVNGEDIGILKATGRGYHSYWQYWSQGASSNSDFQSYGCWMVAQSKLLVEMGIVSGNPAVFNPDIFFNAAGGYNAYAAKYAAQKGYTLNRGSVTLTGNRTTDAATIMQYINNGYYCIVCGPNHHSYIGRQASLDYGQPIMLDSYMSYSYASTQAHTYTDYTAASFNTLYFYWVDNPPVPPTPDAPSAIEFHNVSNPTDQAVGAGFYTSGTIQSTYPIASVQGYFVNTDTGVEATSPTRKTVYPNKTTVDILSDVDPVLYYAQLKQGRWRLELKATDTRGYSATYSTNLFNVGPVDSSIVFSDVSNPPNQARGAGFYTSGTITSTYPIVKVEGYFVDASTYALASKPTAKSVSLNTTSVDILSQVDPILYFAELQVGTWRLALKATDSNGGSETWYSNPFTVSDNADECTTYNCTTAAAGWYRVASTGLNINSGHNWNSYIGEMPPNALVWVSKGSTTANYYHVNYEGLEGISSKNYLTKLASYTLSFDDNGGSGGPGSVTVWDGVSDYSQVSVPFRHNHTFTGYYTDPNGGTQVYNAEGYCTNEGGYWSGNAYVHGGGGTLYAHWKVNFIYVESVALNHSALDLTLGDTGALTATVLPTDASNPALNWFSDDPQVVTVTDGVLSAAGVGSTTVKAQSTDGTEIIAACVVNVLPVYVTSIELSCDDAGMACGDTLYIRSDIQPDDATDQGLIWSSSDNSVATVEMGIVTGVGEGTATITATAADGSGVSGRLAITVVPAGLFELDRHKVSMASSQLGSRYPLPYTLQPADMAGLIVWSSSNPDVAVVDANGLVTAKAAGKATITASVPYGPSDQCIIQVSDDMSLMTLPDDLVTIEEEVFAGVSAKRVAIADHCEAIGSRAFAQSGVLYVFIPTTVTDIAPDAFDGAEAVCIVCGTGSTAEKFAKDNGLTCLIDDEAAFVSVQSVSLPAKLSLEIEDSAALDATISPAIASNPSLTWSSSDESVATVSGDGVVTGVNPGSAVISAEAADGSGARGTCTVTVTLPSVQVTAAANGAQVIEGDRAYLSATLSIAGADAGKVQQAGIVLYNAAHQRIASAMDAFTLDGSGSVVCACDTTEDLNVALTPQTGYAYRCVVMFKGIAFFSDYIAFTTPQLPPRIVLSETSVTLQKGETIPVSATVLYTDDTDVIWRSSKSSVFTVIDGEITARGVGEATLTVCLASDNTVKAVCTVTVTETSEVIGNPTLSLSASGLTLARGQSERLEAAVTPPSGFSVQWSSSDASVAVVDGSGTVTAISAGQADISARIPSLGLQAACTVTVPPVLVESVSLSASALTLNVGTAERLSAEVLPVGADNRAVLWLSSDPSVASVAEGKVTALAEGSAVVTARAADGGGASAECAVTVEAEPVNCGCQTSYAGRYTVSGTNDTGLAISSGHGASTAAGNEELGIIPEGAEVYISRASGPYGVSGNWGHVTYNGLSGYCAMYYLLPVLEVDTSPENVVPEKLNAAIAKANEWADYVWTAPVDIPVYNNNYGDPEEEANYHVYYWYRAGTEMHGIPYTLANSKYRMDTYPRLSAESKGTADYFYYQGWLMWGPKYGGDCTCLVNDALYAGDPTLPHDGQTYMTKKAHLYVGVPLDDLAPGDVLTQGNHAIIVTAVDGDNVTIVESRGNGSSVGAIHCPNQTPRAEGGYYVCGSCEYCNGSKKCGAIRRTVTLSFLRENKYSAHRYKPLYMN